MTTAEFADSMATKFCLMWGVHAALRLSEMASPAIIIMDSPTPEDVETFNRAWRARCDSLDSTNRRR